MKPWKKWRKITRLAFEGDLTLKRCADDEVMRCLECRYFSGWPWPATCLKRNKPIGTFRLARRRHCFRVDTRFPKRKNLSA